MKFLHSLAPLILGVIIVLQGGLNRRISLQWGLSGAVFLNALVLMFAAAIFFAVAGVSAFKPQTFEWWYLVPGLIGCAIVTFIPMSIGRWGAMQTFVLIMSAQLATSVFWDLRVEGIPPSREKLLGVGLTWLGVLLTCRG